MFSVFFPAGARMTTTIPFKKIRAEQPDKFLVLVDCEIEEISLGEAEVLGAKRYRAYDSISEMYNAYRELKKAGQEVMICTPDYQDRFIFERRPSMRVFG